ncbi:hypothetical protein BDY17DRAFT_246332 [Neohortaea acidophila]|uniref:Uncharacterized protein n=1 Tax=Neohortaea acidophila TaxID=245834 RepID=A0A6A6Q250_9PEZI|nr:uncharacterized protein BDY17DRAFT_246332 [Neohortaea acidophila]KAF2486064.1 hypothetical protein BDY17DRAFT_246332 [Neohortaea acidophila]
MASQEDSVTKPKQCVQIERLREDNESDVEGSIDSRQNLRNSRALTSNHVPPTAIPWTTSTIIGFQAFLKWARTPFGFFVVLYSLNVVAWGGMLFLLLCNASPAMCWAPVPTQPRMFSCNNINSPRRIWIEIDSQILNALFCVTGFGLVPWRFRDLYYLLRYRFMSQRRYGLEKKMYGLQVLAGIHRTWFRLPGSSTLDDMSLAEYKRTLGQSTADCSQAEIRVALPPNKQLGDTLSGVRAPATAVWKMDFFVWCNVGNTLFQVMLCFFMWHLDRYNRAPWATGLFIALACIVVGAAGIMSLVEGKKVKKIEGVAKMVGTTGDDPQDMV